MTKLLSIICVCMALQFPFISTVVAHADEYTSISDLYTQTPGRWTESFTNRSGETVLVDCSVEVPNVNQVPVLSATWYPALPKEYVKEYVPSRTAWPMNAAHSDDSYTMLTHNYHYALKESEIRLKYYDEEQFVKLEDLDWNAVYVRNSQLTAGEAFDVIHQAVMDIYSKYGEFGFYDFRPARGLTILSLMNQNGEHVRELDVYSFCGQQIIRGIPILTNAGYTFASSSINSDTMYRYEGGHEAQYYVLHVETEDSYGFAAHLLAEKEIIADDIPLQGFEAAKPDIIDLIEEGYIRDIYGIQFGFVAYPDKQHDLKNYVLFPSWVIECEYYDSPDLVTESVEVPNYSNSQHYRRLVVNAQTGRMLDPRSKGPNRSDPPKIITWEDVR